MKIRGQAQHRSRRRLSPWAAEVTAGAIPSQVTTTKINATAQQAGPALEHVALNSRPSDCEPAQLLVATEIDRELASLRRVEDGEATSYEILPSVDSPTVASSPDAAAGTADGLSAFVARILDQLSLSAWLPAAFLAASLALLLQ